jgi:hypothetical protein
MQTALRDLLHWLVQYSKHLEPGVLGSITPGGVKSLEDLVQVLLNQPMRWSGSW